MVKKYTSVKQFGKAVDECHSIVSQDTGIMLGGLYLQLRQNEEIIKLLSSIRVALWQREEIPELGEAEKKPK